MSLTHIAYFNCLSFQSRKKVMINSKQISDLIVQFILTIMFSINNSILTVADTDLTWALKIRSRRKPCTKLMELFLEASDVFPKSKHFIWPLHMPEALKPN